MMKVCHTQQGNHSDKRSLLSIELLKKSSMLTTLAAFCNTIRKQDHVDVFLLMLLLQNS